jgi:hypothetical protein
VRFVREVAFALTVLVCFAETSVSRAAFVPWDPLVADSWIIEMPDDPKLALHTVNAGDYEIGFDRRRNDGSARGLKALKFFLGGAGNGHLVSDALTGRFNITNTGDNRTFADLVLVVAIDAPALPGGFAMSLGVAGQAAYAFDPATDFGYYDHLTWDAGRPSGYYSGTTPTGAPLTHAFDSGMVTVWAAQDVNIGPNGGSVAVDYAFENLPATAVFNVYGLGAGKDFIYHTNRPVVDANEPLEPVSTFEVAPEPAVLALLACGMAAVSGRKRCGRRR